MMNEMRDFFSSFEFVLALGIVMAVVCGISGVFLVSFVILTIVCGDGQDLNTSQSGKRALKSKSGSFYHVSVVVVFVFFFFSFICGCCLNIDHSD